MTDRLGEIFEMQRALQVESYGYDPGLMQGEERTTFIMWNVVALTDELHEALAEVGWKPWATSRHVNEEAFKGELVDALHFLVNLCLAADMSPMELYEGYLEKRRRNAKRQAEGYDGVSSKCPQCKRALDDVPKERHAFMLDSKRPPFTGDDGMVPTIEFCSKRCAEEYTP